MNLVRQNALNLSKFSISSKNKFSQIKCYLLQLQIQVVDIKLSQTH